ncbi:hypothetical protein MOSE0_K09692 [Monosporozyma servazzii]
MSEELKNKDPINQTTRLGEEPPVKEETDVEPPKDTGKRCCGIFSTCCNSVKTGLYHGFQTTSNCVKNSTSCIYTSTVNTVNCAINSLKNPVVLINSLIGAGALSTLLVGYIKYEKRFLKGQSNAFIWSSILGVTTFLTLDCYISEKYYKKSK